MQRLAGIARLVFCAILVASAPVGAQGVDSVSVEQRVLMTPELTPAEARRRAIDGALAEAVRRVAGVRVQSSALSTLDEQGGAVRGGYSSVVQLDAAARAVDYRVMEEGWETIRPGSAPPQLYLRLRLTAVIEREAGAPDATFRADITLNAPRYDVRSGATANSDEIVATVRTSHAARLVLFTIADDSVHRLFPNEYLPEVRSTQDVATELPDAEWRARGLRLRATLPAGRDNRRELLMLVATRTSVPPPPIAITILELQRWLVRIPLGERAIAFAQYDVRRIP